MGTFQRGTVKKATFHIEYPDGSTKTLDLNDLAGVHTISIGDSALQAEHADLLNVSETEWRQNPALLVHKRDAAGMVELIPFCTHNGCKG
jgi:hypothetical protein